MIHEAIWRDPHFRSLSRSAQCTYFQLLSQKDVDCAGVLPLQVAKWAKGCTTMTETDLQADLAELENERFVYCDFDTDEAFVRSYMRNSNVLKVPNMIKSALRSARLVASEKIREVLAAELRRTNRPDAAETANEIDPQPGTLAEPLPNPSGRVPEPTGMGLGMGTGRTLVTTQVGGATDPPPICPKHGDNNAETPCRACKVRREWVAAAALARERDELDQRRQLREAALSCPDCHGTNMVDDGDNRVRKCDHAAVAQ
jgi:hypothetical protein